MEAFPAVTPHMGNVLNAVASGHWDKVQELEEEVHVTLQNMQERFCR